jgi:hypothetical protein
MADGGATGDLAQDQPPGSASDTMARLIELVRQLEGLLVARGGERLTAKKLRASNPGLWREVDELAPGFIDTFMAAVGGDPEAITRLEKLCPTTAPPPTLQ